MTNEMKLLLAFIEASGYEVEESPYAIIDGVKSRIDGPAIIVNKGSQLSHGVDYKVTKVAGPMSHTDVGNLYQ